MLRRWFTQPVTRSRRGIDLPQAAAYPGSDLSERLARRNRNYHARRQGYPIRVQLCILVVVALCYELFDRNPPVRESGPRARLALTHVIEATEPVVPTRHLTQPPPPPAPPPLIEVADAAPDVPTSDYSSDVAFASRQALPEPPAGPAPPPNEPEPEPEIFLYVQEMPTIVGGLSALKKWVHYPPVALATGIEGTVIVQVVITESGSPTQLKVLRSAHKLLDQAALEAVAELTFTPGKQMGRTVSVQLAIPVRFTLRAI